MSEDNKMYICLNGFWYDLNKHPDLLGLFPRGIMDTPKGVIDTSEGDLMKSTRAKVQTMWTKNGTFTGIIDDDEIINYLQTDDFRINFHKFKQSRELEEKEKQKQDLKNRINSLQEEVEMLKKQLGE